MLDDDRSTPSKDPVPHHEGRSAEYDVIHAIARQFGGITATMLEAARRADQLDADGRAAAVKDVHERLRSIAWEIIGPGYVERPTVGIGQRIAAWWRGLS